MHFTVLDNNEYFHELAQRIAKASSGARIALASMTFNPTEPFTELLMHELYAALGRGVQVTLIIDAHAMMVDDAHSLPTGPLFRHRDMLNTQRADYQRKLNVFDMFTARGGNFALTNIPARPYSVPFAGRSHIKCAIINDDVYIGGCNLSATKQLDSMVRFTHSKTADWLYDFVQNVVRERRVGAVLSQDTAVPIDNKTTLLVDAGHQNESLIYERALAMIDEAREWIIFTCQFFPVGTTADHLDAALRRGVNVKLIYNHARQHGYAQWAHALAEWREEHRLSQDLFTYELPKGAQRIHYKIIASERGAIVGSHNYVSQGVRFGTAEIALQRLDPHFAHDAARIVLMHSPWVNDAAFDFARA